MLVGRHLESYGAARKRANGQTGNPVDKLRRLTSIQNALQRFFWFAIEFGLMRGNTPDQIKAYGCGLLSSYGELVHSIEDPSVQRHPLQLAWVMNDFGQLFEMVGELESWMKAGKLDNVTPGFRQMSEADVQSFLDASLPR